VEESVVLLKRARWFDEHMRVRPAEAAAAVRQAIGLQVRWKTCCRPPNVGCRKCSSCFG
jgi:hypothetical protein